MYAEYTQLQLTFLALQPCSGRYKSYLLNLTHLGRRGRGEQRIYLLCIGIYHYHIIPPPLYIYLLCGGIYQGRTQGRQYLRTPLTDLGGRDFETKNVPNLINRMCVPFFKLFDYSMEL